MSKPNVSSIIQTVKSVLVKRSPEILTGIGIAGMVATTVLAVKATPKALKLIEEAEYEKGDDLKATEKVKACWKCYIPVAVTGVTSVACLVGASSVNARRNAALAAAYTISDSALREYREKVVETIGEKKEKVVRDAVAKEKIEKDPVSTKEVIITEKGDTLCYDGIFGRYFKSDMETIKRAVNKINRQIVCDMYVSLNEFYDELGLSHVPIGDDLGWNIDDGQIEIDFSSQLAEDGTPCLVINYSASPRYDYSTFL